MSLAGPFKFDPRAFWGDENVKFMTGEQIAAYLKIISLQWEEGDVPADPRRLAVLMTEGVRVYTAEDLVGAEGSLEAPLEGSLWAGLKPCFKVDDGRMYNERQEEEREDWIRVKDAMSGGGKKGGKKSGKARKQRSKRRREKASPPSREGSRPPSSPPSREGSSSSSSSSSSSEEAEKSPTDSGADAPGANGEPRELTPHQEQMRHLVEDVLIVKYEQQPPKKGCGKNATPNYGVLAKWLKTAGSMERLEAALEQLHGAGKMGNWSYFFKALPDWSARAEKRRGRPDPRVPAVGKEQAAERDRRALAP